MHAQLTLVKRIVKIAVCTLLTVRGLKPQHPVCSRSKYEKDASLLNKIPMVMTSIEIYNSLVEKQLIKNK